MKPNCPDEDRPRSSLTLKQRAAKEGCAVDGLGAIGHAERVQDGHDMGFDGHIRNAQFLSNDLVRLALDQPRKNLALTGERWTCASVDGAAPASGPRYCCVMLLRGK